MTQAPQAAFSGPLTTSAPDATTDRKSTLIAPVAASLVHVAGTMNLKQTV